MRVMSGADSDFVALFLGKVGRSVQSGVRLADHSYFRIGGPADFFFEAGTVGELRGALDAAREAAVRAVVIGAGSNILFDDAGFRGLILKNAVRGLRLESPPPGAPDGRPVEASAGTPLRDLVEFGAANGLAGLEFLAGIPGTVGGAVFGNAGAFGRCLSESLEWAHLLGRDGAERRETRDYFDFGYRDSKLKRTGETVLLVSVLLTPGNPASIRDLIDEYLGYRAARHPSPGTACAGSYFKNPIGPDGVKIPAGSLLERVGAKDASVGGAAVFHGHANFLYNRGGATAADVLALARDLKERVRTRLGVALEEEVIFLRAVPEGG
jgi:UDP-N-acetylmuramate dehydrogenase